MKDTESAAISIDAVSGEVPITSGSGPVSTTPAPAGVVWFEGLFGCGKTSLVRALATSMGARPMYEPVDANPFLHRYYLDPANWAWHTQLWYALERCVAHKTALWSSKLGELVLLDRALPGDRVFQKGQVRAGNISAEEDALYDRLFDYAMTEVQTPSLLVWLEVDPEIVYERIVLRNRVQEREFIADKPNAIRTLRELRAGYYDLFAQIESGKHPWGRGIVIERVPWSLPFQDPKIVEALIRRHLAK